ncbi:hypothetical protein SAY87_015135 [Trapa incisa]|uniref:Trehalose 6-phosphate phosphatase n=1 Tax=Trapa incisa TaxID=236973 RepID=A0AAN7GTR0_9MYRT|nr:hypothetical protein SAY87_015135 [Trapa incisa]
METPNHTSPVLADSSPTSNNTKLRGIHSGLLPYAQQSTHFSPSKYIKIPRRKPVKPDDVSSNGWLDAMRASSPPRKKLVKDFNCEIASENPDSAYLSWMNKYPSALSSFDKIMDQAKGKKIAIFLDYDGTLSPIVDDPDCAIMSNDMRSAVKNVAAHFPTAIISGRRRDMVYDLVGLTELYYAGSHGMDIMGPVNINVSNRESVKSINYQGNELNLFQPAREFLPVIDKVFRVLVESTKGIKGAKVENHKFCASVHYRNVEEKNWCVIAQCVHDVLKVYPCLRLTHGRKVLEVRPVIDWNKGKAVEFLLDSLGLSNSDDVLAIYMGDDKTDEDAFKALRQNKYGFGILVSSSPKETNAYYSLKDPTEVMKFLIALGNWKKA